MVPVLSEELCVFLLYFLGVRRHPQHTLGALTRNTTAKACSLSLAGHGETHGDNHPMCMSPVAAVLTRVHCLQQDGQIQEWRTEGSFRGVAAPQFFLPRRLPVPMRGVFS